MAYKVIHETFWTDPRVKHLPFKTKAFFIFLIAGPSAHYCGLYYLPKAYMVEQTGLLKKDISALLKTLVDEGFVQYDEVTECIWVVNMLKHQMKGWGGNRNNVAVGIQKHLELLHNSVLIKPFIAKYHILKLTLPEGWGTVAPTPPVSVSVSVSGSGSGVVLSEPDKPDSDLPTPVLDPDIEIMLRRCPKLSILNHGGCKEFWDGIIASVETYKLGAEWLNKELIGLNTWMVNKNKSAITTQGTRRRVSFWIRRALDKVEESR